MRTVLTFVAFALVAVLSLALVAPPFVDWTAERAQIEAQLSERLGMPLRTSGPIEVRLLPIAYVEFGGLEAGPAGAPVFVSEHARFEISLASLLAARLRFAEVDLTRPALKLDLEATSRLGALPAALAAAGAEKLKLRGGSLVLSRGAAGATSLAALDVDASAGSLLGPFRGEGATTLADGRRIGFEFVASAVVAGALPIKAAISDGNAAWKATFDGALSATPGGRVAFTGATTLSGALGALDDVGPLPWKLAGALSADTRAARLENLTASFGAESRALTATGRVEAALGPNPTLKAELKAKQLNIDGLLRREGEDSAPPPRALAALASLGRRFVDGGAPTLGVEVAFATPAAYVGAETLDDISFVARGQAGAPLRLTFATGLPGAGRLSLDGAFEFGASPHFVGAAQASAHDLGALGIWAARADAATSAKVESIARALPYGLVSVKGDIEASKAGFSLRNLTLALDRTTLTGAAAFTASTDSSRARVFLDLASDALDIDAAPDLASNAFWIGDFDLSVALRANRLRVAHAGEAAVESGSLALSATREGERFKLERLSVAGLGGASVEAQGEATPSRLWGKATLDAAKLGDFAALVARVAPDRFSRWLVDHAAGLSPAKATFEARREGESKGGPFPFDFAAAEGVAGGVRFKLGANNAPAPVSALFVDANAEAADGGAWLTVLGLRPAPGAVAKSSIHINASGGFEAGFDGQLAASFAGADVTWKGRLTPNATAPDDPLLFGAATLKAADLTPALVALRMASASANVAAPVDLGGDFTLRGAKISVPRLSGSLVGAKIAGQLAWTPPQEVDAAALSSDVAVAQSIAGEAPAPSGGLTGEISLDRATASGLLSLPLGVLAAVKAPLRWSDNRFAEPLLIPPTADVTLHVGSLDLGGVEAKAASARLSADRGKFELTEASFDAAGAHFAGHAALRRDGPNAAITGGLEIQHGQVDRPALSGKFGLSVDFATSGTSPSGLVAGLVGQGQATTMGLALPRLDLLALGRLLAKAEAPEVAIDETHVQFELGKELDRAALALPDASSPLALASGKFRLGPFAVERPGGRASALIGFDLQTFEFSADAAFSSDHVGKYWSGGAPAFAVTLRGPLDAPQRRIDDTALAAGLASQAISRESDRISALEADIRERAAFNRHMKAWAFVARRQREIADFVAEQQRQQMEVERRRSEDALMKLLDDQEKADELAKSAPPAPKPIATPAPTPVATPVDPTASGLY